MARLFLVLFLLSPAARADEAVLPGGGVVKGELSLTRSGRLSFVPQKRGADAEGAVEYRLAGSPAPFRAGPGMLLRLPGGEELSGLFLGLDGDKLLLRTAWADRLEVPRRAVVALTHLPGWRPVFRHDLTGKLAGWTVKGAPDTTTAGVALERAGQSLNCRLARPLAAGRVSVNFQEKGKPVGARWLVEAVFGGKAADRVVRITLAGAGPRLQVDPGGLAGTAGEVGRTGGPRRLVLAFTSDGVRIRADEDVLWYALGRGPGGPLREVRLACVGGEKEATGGLVFSSFVVEQAVGEQRHPRGDSGQDELWLAAGDQLFGRVVRADGRSIELKGRFGVRRFDWTELRGWFPRQQGARPALPAAPAAPAVRVGIRSGLRPGEDVLLGTLGGLDGRQVRLRHALLGEVVIDRSRVAWLRPVVNRPGPR